MLTKELKVQELETGRKIRLSSNLLRNFGFTPQTRLAVHHDSRALILAPDEGGSIKVHERRYGGTRSREAVIELASQQLIDRFLPSGYDRVHFTFERSRLTLRPVCPHLFHIRKAFRTVDTLHAFMALSSGVDAAAFADVGFRISAALDWRPPEARDRSDLTESGIQTFLANHQPSLVFNEDLTTVNSLNVGAILRRKLGPIACLSIGLQCDDFSSVKSAALKRTECQEFRPSSRELGYYATKLLENVRPASCLIEQVPGWLSSESAAVMGAVLRRLGYHVHACILNSADYGACTTRRRCYFVASIFPGYEFPKPTGENRIPLSEALAEEVPKMRDVSHTRTIAKARDSNYCRFTPLSAVTAPTILKSQHRQTKDSIYFELGDRLLFPTVNALRTIQGIPASFDFGQVSAEVATEQIGQGVDFGLHAAVAQSLITHLRSNQVGQSILDFGNCRA